jgi:hypothetical protein
LNTTHKGEKICEEERLKRKKNINTFIKNYIKGCDRKITEPDGVESEKIGSDAEGSPDN